MTETLIDRVAEKNADGFSDDIVTETMIKEIKVVKESGEYKIKYLDSNDKDSEICYLSDLVDNSVEEIIDRKEYIISSETIEKLEELQIAVQKIWDDTINMYSIFYRQNDNGSAELYIPLDTEYSDDIIVEKIYNDNNKFVAQDLESKIDFPIHKIDTIDLYASDLNEGSSIFTKNRMSLSDKFQQSYKRANYFNLLENDENVITIYLFLLLITSILYGGLFIASSTVSVIFALSLWIILMMSGMLPLVLVALLMALTYDIIKTITNMRATGNYTTNQIA